MLDLLHFHKNIAKTLTARKQYRLVCSECKREVAITTAEIAQYLKSGWPKCCGYTMTMEEIGR